VNNNSLQFPLPPPPHKYNNNPVLDDLVDNGDRMLNRAKQSAAGEEDPRARKDLLDAIARLEDMLRKLRPDAERAASNPRDNKAQVTLIPGNSLFFLGF